MYRTVADWGQFRLPVYLFKRPVSGWLHGSFILINGALENAITWDTSCIAEDYWFGLQVRYARFRHFGVLMGNDRSALVDKWPCKLLFDACCNV